MNKKVLKNATKRALITGIAAGTLLACTGCKDDITAFLKDTVYKGNATPFPTVTTRSPEEIEASGLTGEDVLAIGDIITQNIADHVYGHSGVPVSAQLVEIAPYKVEGYDGADNETTKNADCYYMAGDIPFSATFTDDKSFDGKYIQNVYPVSLTYDVILNGDYHQILINNCPIEKRVFENFCEFFGKEQFIITDEWLDRHDNNWLYSKYRYSPAYEAFTLDRDTILNANPEQLTAIHDVLKSFEDINLKGNIPNIDYSIED